MDQLAGYKRIIYEGLFEAVEGGVPRDTAAILVDQKYGAALLADAKKRSITTCLPLEKSGQAEFDYEYGEDFGKHLDEAAPTFAKVLVRYNPDDDADVNEEQRLRLKVLSDYAHAEGYRFMFELLVPGTTAQLGSVDGDTRTYDVALRPGLAGRAIEELQDDGIEPDVWKLKGMDDSEAALKVVAQVRSGGRDNVGVIVLGRGEDEARVREWLTVGARTEGVIGFAVGRTVFWKPLVDYKDGATSRPESVSRIAATYAGLHALFTGERARAQGE